MFHQVTLQTAAPVLQLTFGYGGGGGGGVGGGGGGVGVGVEERLLHRGESSEGGARRARRIASAAPHVALRVEIDLEIVLEIDIEMTGALCLHEGPLAARGLLEHDAAVALADAWLGWG